MKEYKLTSINPFTPKQQEAINEILDGKTSYIAISESVDISPHTVRYRLYGRIPIKKVLETPLTSRSRLGIKGIIQKLTENRPYNFIDLLNALREDVLLEKRE